MKVAYVIFARNKMRNAAQMEKCVRAALAQTYTPLEVVLSDQGSSDGTRELLHRLAAEYTGPHTVRLLDCPETALTGMAGLNAHLAWLHAELDCDIFVPSAADDDAHPERTAKLVEAFERTGADMVGAAMQFADPAGRVPVARSAYARTGWVTVADCVFHKVGGSSAPAWRRSLWDRLMPIPALCSPDVWMPPAACLLGGFYYINEPLYTYFTHADADNTGLEGVMRAQPAEAQAGFDELRFFQTAASWQWVLRRMTTLKVGGHDDQYAVERAILAHAEAWSGARTDLTLRREAPRALPI